VAEIKENGTEGYFGDPSFLWCLMPFDGDELAAVIIDADVNGSRVEAFGLARTEPNPSVPLSQSWSGEHPGVIYDERDDPPRSDLYENMTVYRIDAMKFRITGMNPPPAAVVDYCREVSNWWRTLDGERLAPGRRRKSVPYAVAQAAYWEVRTGLEIAGERRKPSYQEVCDHLDAEGMSLGVTRFGEIVKEWSAEGRPWPPPALE
jgi:hypothetical protein